MIKRIIQLVKKLLFSKEELAREAGVNIGKDNFIGSYFWSSEPYLITIGSHCQITAGVHIFTHGGGVMLRDMIIPGLIVSEKLK